MRKTSLLSPAALLLGLAGGLIRARELDTVFDAGSGLADAGAGISRLLIALAVLTAAGSLAAAFVLKAVRTEPEKFRKAFYIRRYLTFAVMALLGIAVVACGASCALRGIQPLGLSGISKWVFAGLMILSGVGMTVMAYAAYTQKDTPPLPLFSVIPALFFCYWMVALYRVNAGNPVLLDFCYSVLALAAAAMSFYYFAGYAYGRRNLRGAVFTGLTAVFLLTVAAADPAPWELRATLLLAAVFECMLTSRYLAALRAK